MKKTKILAVAILLVFVSLITIGCDPSFFRDGCHSHIKFANNSSIDICTDDNYAYPDTTLYGTNPLRRGRKVVAGTTGVGSGIGGVGLCIEDRFDNLHPYFSIFIFDAKFMENNLPNENFRINETMALQRYDLTINDLNKLNWTIPYPPDERMKYMKMYPPYKE